MTEKEIYTIQNDLYWSLLKRFNSSQIPPLLQKIIMEGIYSRFQTSALQYDWDLNIQEYAKQQQKKYPTEEIEFRAQNEKNIPVDWTKDSKGTTKDIEGEVSYE